MVDNGEVTEQSLGPLGKDLERAKEIRMKRRYVTSKVQVEVVSNIEGTKYLKTRTRYIKKIS